MITIGNTPCTPRKFPSSDNSAVNRQSAVLSAGIVPCALSSPTAIGRSSPGLSFLMSAGARLIVIFSARRSMFEFLIAVRTRSFDSRTEAFGSPTMSKLGMPFELSTSTEMIKPSTPSVAAPYIFANNLPPHPLTSNAFSI